MAAGRVASYQEGCEVPIQNSGDVVLIQVGPVPQLGEHYSRI